MANGYYGEIEEIEDPNTEVKEIYICPLQEHPEVDPDFESNPNAFSYRYDVETERIVLLIDVRKKMDRKWPDALQILPLSEEKEREVRSWLAEIM